MLKKLYLFAIVACTLCFNLISQTISPDGFTITNHASGINQPVGYFNIDADNGYTWLKTGKVHLINHGNVISPAVIDLEEEVGSWHDHGLLSITLHPDFKNNGYIYLLYVVDRHHLYNYGTENYSADSSYDYEATIGRVTRYTINTENYGEIINDSRKIILGKEVDDGLPIVCITHGVGTVSFGNDTSLLVSLGDANFQPPEYHGGPPYPDLGYDSLALKEGIISPLEDVTAYRSQLKNSLAGKILRINPETGEGLPGNPWYNENQPSEKKSKVWNLGLRNPFRFYVLPSEAPQKNHPGTIFISDVGFYRYEEINISRDPGTNFGWPVYEGMDRFWSYNNIKKHNLEWPNPYYNDGSCQQEYYYFYETIGDASENHNATHYAGCNDIAIPDSISIFIHERPALSYTNTNKPPPEHTHVPIYDTNGKASYIDISEEDSPVEGEIFNGYSSIAGVYYTHNNFPNGFKQHYFHGDLSGWIKMFELDESYNIKAVEPFLDDYQGLVHISSNEYDGCLYLTNIYNGTIDKICYGKNIKPTAKVAVDKRYGTSPITVNFDASNSYDSDGEIISYHWDFGNNVTSNKIDTTVTFTSVGESPEVITIRLTVVDDNDDSTTIDQIISLNNTPPVARISSFEDGDTYSLENITNLALTAEVFDAEHTPEELEYEWRKFLFHNTHFHEEAPVYSPTSSMRVEPIGCDPSEKYHYGVILMVKDPGGLTSSDTNYIFPDCETVGFTQDTNISIDVSPNPVKDYLNISIENLRQASTIKLSLYTIDGTSAYKKTYTNYTSHSIELNFNNLPPTVYILKIDVSDKSYIKKVVKY